jgi:hypothetical protein
MCNDNCEEHRVSLNDYRRDLTARGFTFRPTTNYWAPNFPVDMVAIRVGPMAVDGWQIYVTGADDDTMSIVRPTREEIMQIYKKVPFVISKTALLDLGFGA